MNLEPNIQSEVRKRNINNLRYTDDPTLMAESEDKLNSDESERGE